MIIKKENLLGWLLTLWVNFNYPPTAAVSARPIPLLPDEMSFTYLVAAAVSARPIPVLPDVCEF